MHVDRNMFDIKDGLCSMGMSSLEIANNKDRHKAWGGVNHDKKDLIMLREIKEGHEGKKEIML